MPSCEVKSCKNYTQKVKKKDGISYFCFPRNEIRKEKWRRIIAKERGDTSYKPKPHSLICSDHFSEDDYYVTNKGLKRLNNTALPIVQVAEVRTVEIEIEIPALKKEKNESPSELCSGNNLNMSDTIMDPLTIKKEPVEVDDESCQTDTPPVTKPLMTFKRSPSPSSSVDPTLDSLRTKNLEKDLRLYKNRLSDKNKKINNLLRINKRLKRKNAVLKASINALKKGKDLDKLLLDLDVDNEPDLLKAMMECTCRAFL